jgi:hypothetical protein
MTHEEIVEEIITIIDDNLSLIVGEESEWYEVAECKTEMRAKLEQTLTIYRAQVLGEKKMELEEEFERGGWSENQMETLRDLFDYPTN